jgi:hypothetical protein
VCSDPSAAVASFPNWLNMKAVHVAQVRADEKIFIGVSSWSEKAGVAASQVGSGCLAYVGDVNVRLSRISSSWHFAAFRKSGVRFYRRIPGLHLWRISLAVGS